MKDLENVNIFGGSPETVELQKAMVAGTLIGEQTNGLTTLSGAPLKIENLKTQMIIAAERKENAAFYFNLGKTKVAGRELSTRTQTSYGSSEGIMTGELEAAVVTDGTYVRKTEAIKIAQVGKSVSLLSTLVDMGGIDPKVLEAKNAVLEVIRGIDRQLFFGDANLVPEEFNGFIAQQRSEFLSPTLYANSSSVVDMRGKALSESRLEDGIEVISEVGHGMGDYLIAPPTVLSDFAKRFQDSKNIFLGNNGAEGGNINSIVGQSVKYFEGQFGRVMLQSDKFLKSSAARYTVDGPILANPSIAAPTAPATLTATPVVSDTSAKFNSVAEAGDFYYAVAARNNKGKSALVASTLTTVAVGGAIDLTFPASVSPTVTSYVIYRSKKNPVGAIGTVPMYEIFSVSVNERAVGYDGAAAAAVRDRNHYLPGTEKAIMAENNGDIWEIAELLPMSKYDLPFNGNLYPWITVNMLTPRLFLPKRIVTYINIGRDLSV